MTGIPLERGRRYGGRMAFFVKVIPTGKRARIHGGECMHCRNGQSQAGQDRVEDGPTYWRPAYPLPGYKTVAEAQQVMAALDYVDVGVCGDCKDRGLVDA